MEQNMNDKGQMTPPSQGMPASVPPTPPTPPIQDMSASVPPTPPTPPISQIPQAPQTPVMPSPIQQTSAIPVADNNKQKISSGLKIAIIAVACIVAVCGIGFGIRNILSNEQTWSTESVKESLISNTTWISNGGSEVVFSKDRIDWYQDPKDHSDNYYSGVYKFYIGKKAVDYITQGLSEYSVTRDELNRLFSSGKYNEDEFVVFDIRYDKFILKGKEQEIDKPLVPWFGFILEDNTYLDVANMNTGTHYGFTKVK